MNNFKEKLMHGVFAAAACVSVLAVLLICLFLFGSGIPAIGKIGISEFLLGTKWKPGNDVYGIFPMILGSLCVTFGAIIIGVPVGILTAIFMANFCPEKLRKILKPAVDLLAGIPSVVYGFFGLMVIVPLVRTLFGGSGTSMLSACIVLGIMILPTIINVSASALDAVPKSYYEGSLALGATHERSVFCAVVPAAKSGILTGIVLGIGRALGEAMAINMVAGGAVNLPLPFASVRFLTTQIVSEMGYAGGLHREVLFTVGLVLFIFIMIINFILLKARKRGIRDA